MMDWSNVVEYIPIFHCRQRDIFRICCDGIVGFIMYLVMCVSVVFIGEYSIAFFYDEETSNGVVQLW